MENAKIVKYNYEITLNLLKSSLNKDSASVTKKSERHL